VSNQILECKYGCDPVRPARCKTPEPHHKSRSRAEPGVGQGLPSRGKAHGFRAARRRGYRFVGVLKATAQASVEGGRLRASFARHRRGSLRGYAGGPGGEADGRQASLPTGVIGRWAMMASFGAAVVLLPSIWSFLPRFSSSPAPLHLRAELGVDASLATGGPLVPAMALSRDGHTLAFAAHHTFDEPAHLYVSRLNAIDATRLPGTEGARHPFFSPDGRWIGFFAGGKLKKIQAFGGGALTLADAPDDRGGFWGDDGTIVFTPSSRPGVGLWRVPAAGGRRRRSPHSKATR
jgi:hypothetical protein